MVPFLHIGALALIDRAAFIPYLFAGNTGAMEKYFRYRVLPYAPPQWWYDPDYVPIDDVMVWRWNAGCAPVRRRSSPGRTPQA